MNHINPLPKLIFFDYDNTLVDSTTHEIPQSARQALHSLSKQGYQIALATGRSLPYLKETGVCDEFNWVGYCLNNGQVVLDSNLSTIYHHLLPQASILEVIHLAKQKGFNVFFSSPEGDFLMDEPDPYVVAAHEFFAEPIPEVKTFRDQPIDKLLVYAPLGYDYAEFRTIEGLDVFVSIGTYADLAKAGISKHSGIIELCQHLELEPIYAAFGDSQNDIEMLKGAHLAVAMGNADPLLKEVAHVIAPHLKEDGLYQILKDLGYI
jgi:Cof subfamily protein (haloacid dehalogenase superfamily)